MVPNRDFRLRMGRILVLLCCLLDQSSPYTHWYLDPKVTDLQIFHLRKKFFTFICDSRANFLEFRTFIKSKNFFFRKKISNIFAFLMLDDEAPLTTNAPAELLILLQFGGTWEKSSNSTKSCLKVLIITSIVMFLIS